MKAQSDQTRTASDTHVICIHIIVCILVCVCKEGGGVVPQAILPSVVRAISCSKPRRSIYLVRVQQMKAQSNQSRTASDIHVYMYTYIMCVCVLGEGGVTFGCLVL